MNQHVSFARRLLVWTVVCVGSAGLRAAEPNVPRVEFNRDIRPILSDKCFICHGPDSAKRQGELRLDRAVDATAKRDGPRAIVPRDPEQSEVVRRIVSRDPDGQMPPPKSNLSLTPQEVTLIRQWIEQGAEYQPHWAFLAPHAVVPPIQSLASGERLPPGSSLPGPNAPSRSLGPIDSFIRAKLPAHNLASSAEADKMTLLRRASFDLIGLPPTPDEIETFVGDSSPDAFEKQIDRLLASPRYGERIATLWLDAARYADTNGYQTDGPRFMWRYRDWVINALNRNQPFDEFTIDQLAGDLLPQATASSGGSSPVPSPPSSGERASGVGTKQATIADDRLIATGFNRNHRGNAEGGIIPEEFRVEYVVDRVETTSTVWLGLTIGCARCHDHKYDPVSQREFYQLFAFFNLVPEPGKYIRNSNSMPYLPAPTPDQLWRLQGLQRESDSAQAAWAALAPTVQAGMKRTAEAITNLTQSTDWTFESGLDAHLALDRSALVRRLVAKTEETKGTAPTTGAIPTQPGTLTETTQPAKWLGGEAKYETGRIGQAAEFDGKCSIDAGDVGDFNDNEIFAISCWVKPHGTEAMTILARMDHDNASKGYELRLEKSGRLQSVFAGRVLDDLIRVESQEPLARDRWSHVFVAYDGSSAARGVSLRVNGEPMKLNVITDMLSNPFRGTTPLIVGGGGTAQPFLGQLDELRLYRGRLTEEAALSLAAADSISQIASGQLGNTPTTAHIAKLREFYLSRHAPEVERRARQEVLDTRSRYDAYLATVPTTMVMQDVPGLREAHILARGEYDKPGERVSTGVPSALPPLRGMNSFPPNHRSEETTLPPANRLDLAHWLVAPENPLTARVTVNRLWQTLFGNGLVKTSEDFGVQGELPSHPELLDWLAIEFSGNADSKTSSTGTPAASKPQSPSRNPQSAWDIKRALRRIITSATYRQSSRVDETQLARDPDNRWLARGPRFRLTAEMIRDAALMSSGLLVESLGGPSVKPYQPSGLWEELASEATPGPYAVYVQDHGASLYRRSLYTFQKRTVTTPGMAIFDASSRDFCRVKLPRTNTPLQALNLMNDVTYLEAARNLAEHAMREGGASTESRITWAFRRVLSRSPDNHELSLLVRSFDRRMSLFRNHSDEVQKLLTAGESPHDESLPAAQLAAFTTIASEIMTLDETVNRN